MVFNIRDPKTWASVHPQYNMVNVVYRLFVQIFQRIEAGRYPPYIDDYRHARGITDERVLGQKRLIADLLDGLFAKEYSREPGVAYLRKAMKDCRWSERFDWEAMGVFDMLASQSLLAYAFGVLADLVSEEDLIAQDAGELRQIVDRQCGRALDRVVGMEPDVSALDSGAKTE